MNDKKVADLVAELRHECSMLCEGDNSDGVCTFERAADELERLAKENERAREAIAMAQEGWNACKEQSLRDQIENAVLKAQLRGAHATHPGTAENDYSVPELVQFLEEAARCAKEGTWGQWRSKEFASAAKALDVMYESYLAVCEHERILHGSGESKA